jgi:multidrug efflux pump
MRRALGVAVFSGMLGVTAFGLFFTPVFYYVVRWLGDRMSRRKATIAPMLAIEPMPDSTPSEPRRAVSS